MRKSTNQCIWKSSQYNITIITMASSMCVRFMLVFHQSKCINGIKLIHTYCCHVYIFMLFHVLVSLVTAMHV